MMIGKNTLKILNLYSMIWKMVNSCVICYKEIKHWNCPAQRVLQAYSL